MTPPRSREPFVVIGGGLSGLAAAWTLERAGQRATVVERASRVGGRAATWYGPNWVADTGLQYIRRGDQTLMNLVRALGLDEHLVSVQGALGSFDSLGRVAPPSPADYATDRLAFEQGFQFLAQALARDLTVMTQAFATAIRWDNEDRSFWFETERGKPLMNEVTGQLLATRGVVLATNSLQAAAIARRSLCLAPAVPSLSAVHTDPAVLGIYLVPRQKTRFYALRGSRDAKLSWIAFEERKAPERAPADKSVLVAVASPILSEHLLNRTETDMLSEIYSEAKAILPSLPSEPFERHQVVWPAATLSGPPFHPPLGESLTQPDGIPLAVAGDFALGATAEDAVRAGVLAAQRVMELYGAQHSGRLV